MKTHCATELGFRVKCKGKILSKPYACRKKTMEGVFTSSFAAASYFIAIYLMCAVFH